MSARRFFPENGRHYELFDSSVLLFVLAFIGLVIAGPTAAQAAALRNLPIAFVGIALSISATYGVVASYSDRLISSGYYVVTAASGMMAGLYLVSAFYPDAPVARTVVWAFVFGSIARRLVREENCLGSDQKQTSV